MATTKNMQNLVINEVESQEVYEHMVANGLINENELYLVRGSEESMQSIATAEIDAMFE